jgi:hypothetical protein
MGATPKRNWSAKGGARSSLQYEGEGVLIHPPHQGVCRWHGTEEQRVTSGGLAESPVGAGSLLHRKTFHSQGCAKCARGIGHPQWVLNVNYPGGKNRQITLHRGQLPQVRRQLRNFHQLKKTLEAICEFNQLSLRSDDQRRPARRQSRD